MLFSLDYTLGSISRNKDSICYSSSLTAAHDTWGYTVSEGSSSSESVDESLDSDDESVTLVPKQVESASQICTGDIQMTPGKLCTDYIPSLHAISFSLSSQMMSSMCAKCLACTLISSSMSWPDELR